MTVNVLIKIIKIIFPNKVNIFRKNNTCGISWYIHIFVYSKYSIWPQECLIDIVISVNVYMKIIYIFLLDSKFIFYYDNPINKNYLITKLTMNYLQNR